MATEVSIGTISTHFAVTNPGGNVTASSIVEPANIGDGTTPPAQAKTTGVQANGDGVFNLSAGGSIAYSAVMIVPFGAGSDAQTFAMNVYGWFFVNPPLTPPVGNFPGYGLWVPVVLATFTSITLDSNFPGFASTQVGTSNLFCRAITLGVGNSGTSVEVVSPGGTTHEMAHVVVSTKGAKYIETRFSTGGSATSCNALIRGM